MKLKIISSLVLCSIIFTVGCASSQSGKFSEVQMQSIAKPQRQELPVPTGGFTLSIGTEQLAAEEVLAGALKTFEPAAREASSYVNFQQLATNNMQMLVANKIADLLLYQQARNELPENVNNEMLDKIVEEEVKRFVASHGGNYSDSEKAIKQMGLNWDGFREYQKRMMVTQSFIAGKSKDARPITHNDVLSYYNSVKAQRFVTEPSIQFRLIDIDFDAIELPDDPNSTKTKHDVAMETVEKISEALTAGQKFEELAKQYSNGFTAQKGGLWDSVAPGSLASPYDTVEAALKNLSAGQVTETIEVQGHVFIAQLVERKQASSIPFVDVQNRLEQELNYMQKRELMDKLMKELLQQVDPQDADRFISACLRLAYDKLS